MKTKSKIGGAFIIFLLLSYMQIGDNLAQSELSLANIEALADKESGIIYCFGYGSVDCPRNNTKVYQVL